MSNPNNPGQRSKIPGAAPGQPVAKAAVKPRKRVVPLWRTHRTQWTALLGVVVIMAGTGTWGWFSGSIEAAWNGAKWKAIAKTSEMGMTVQDVLVTGRSETSREALLGAMQVERGAPIMAYDFNEAKERIEALPWVLSARVERLLPDTLVAHLIERRPMALWQKGGKFYLIDDEGEVITDRGLDRFSGLIHVVGPDAPQNVGGLLELLETQPEIRDAVAAAVRIGGRRWDLRLVGGIDVRLPEVGAPDALERLRRFDARNELLKRDIRILDLRMPDRVILRRQAKPKPKPEAKARQDQNT